MRVLMVILMEEGGVIGDIGDEIEGSGGRKRLWWWWWI